MTTLKGRLSEKLQAYHWFEQLLEESRLKDTQIDCFPGHQSRSRGVAKWRARERIPSARSVSRLKKAAPHAAEHYRTTPYKLLSGRRLSVAETQRLISVYIGKGENTTYCFPDSRFAVKGDGLQQPLRRRQSPLLAHRGDFYALLAIVALVREAGEREEWNEALMHLRAMYRCLAGLGRYPWTARDFGLLCRVCYRIHGRYAHLALRWGVNWSVITEQYLDPCFHPNPMKRPIHAETGQVIEYAEPLFPLRDTVIGEPPPWPWDSLTARDPHESKSADSTHGLDAVATLDTVLVGFFLSIMAYWGAPRHAWEAYLGTRPGEIDKWLYTGDMRTSDNIRTRMSNLVEIWKMTCLAEDTGSSGELAFQRKRVELGGKSLKEALSTGDVANTLLRLKRGRSGDAD